MKRLLVLLILILFVPASASAKDWVVKKKKDGMRLDTDGQIMVDICHKGSTLNVSWNSWIHGHKKHGDSIGECKDERISVNLVGNNGRVAVTDSESMNLSGPFTLEAWIWANSLSGRQDIIYKWGGGGRRSYFLQIAHGKLEVAISTTGTKASVPGVYSSRTLSLHKWTHVAGVYDGSELTLFIDGVKDASTLPVPGGAFAGKAPVYIGGTSSSSFEPFDGRIDEVRISDVARYKKTFSILPFTEFKPDEHTILLMHMNEGAGTTTKNLGTTGGDGVLFDGATW